MAYLRPYKHINRLIENETFEPMISWGVRMAISAMVPLIWGLSTGNVKNAIWMTLTAECLCWVELKGSFIWQARTLLGGAMLTILFSVLGSLTGANIWLSVLFMLIAGFIATLLKNLGDRASGLAICVYLMFIFCNAYPVTKWPDIRERVAFIGAGAAWAMVVSIATTLFAPVQQPFRRQIALVWRAIANLVATVNKGWNDNDVRSNVKDIYTKEKEVRAALDSSYTFFETTAHQANKKENNIYQLAQLRKSTSLVATHILAISEEMETISIKELDASLRSKAGALLSAFNDCAARMAMLSITLRAEDELLVTSSINRLKNLAGLLKQHPAMHDGKYSKSIRRIVQLSERAIRLIENALHRLDNMGGDKAVIRTYSLGKTLVILNPKQLVTSIRLLTNFNTFNTRYALRTAIATGVAMFIYKWFKIDHGYWLPFSVMIIIQPYFGATFKRAIERVAGTLLGGLTGSLFLSFPSALHLKEAMLFVTFVLMVYYLRRQYAITAFVVTLNLVLLFNIELQLNNTLLITRALCTLGGASLAVVSGFALLPNWDRKWLPRHLAGAVNCNYLYFVATFFSAKPLANWTQSKRSAESKNSNVFDSFNRFIAEPTGKKNATLYYDLITYNIRITRDLNNIHLEQDDRQDKPTESYATPVQQKLLNDCLQWFNKIAQEVKKIDPAISGITTEPSPLFRTPLHLSEIQTFYLEKLLVELKTMYQDIERLTDKEHVE